MYVNTKDVMTLASTVEITNNKIADAADEVIAAMNRLYGSWDGASASAVVSLSKRREAALRNMQDFSARESHWDMPQ